MKKIYPLLVNVVVMLTAGAQYISRSQPVPFSCPTVCPGSVMVLDVPQVQNLNVGDTVEAWLSNAAGSFSSGTSTLIPTQYSLTTGSTWINGPYIYSSSVNNLYIEVTIPSGLPVGSNYTILMKTSSGFVAGDYFSCSGTDSITVTAAYPTLPAQPDTTVGINQWIGHVYTWAPTTSQPLFTTALVDSQDFYDPDNYQGFFLKDSLSFDINWLTASGGTCPGVPGVLNDGTSIPCSEGWTTDFSVQFLRTQNFAPGSYKLSIQGDDGIRLSIDGGQTWLISSFFEQTYADGYVNTDTLYPNGICLSGPTNLVIDYFERNVDSRATFTATLLSGISVSDAGNQTVCEGGNATFALSGTDSLTYQWYYSTDGGDSFIKVPDAAPFSGAVSSTLSITDVPTGYNNYLFRCSVGGLCGNAVNTNVDTLFVGGSGTQANLTANKTAICPNDSATICAPAGCVAYLWGDGQTTQCITTNLAGDYSATVTYSGGCTAASNRLSIMVYSVPSVSISVTGDTLHVFSGLSWQWYNYDSLISGAVSNYYIMPYAGSYTVQITDSNGCPALSNPVNWNPSAINNVNETIDFNVYPNPVTGNTALLLSPAELKGASLKMFDALGRQVLTAKITQPETVLDFTGLAKGVYILCVGGRVKKIVNE